MHGTWELSIFGLSKGGGGREGWPTLGSFPVLLKINQSDCCYPKKSIRLVELRLVEQIDIIWRLGHSGTLVSVKDTMPHIGSSPTQPSNYSRIMTQAHFNDIYWYILVSEWLDAFGPRDRFRTVALEQLRFLSRRRRPARCCPDTDEGTLKCMTHLHSCSNIH